MDKNDVDESLIEATIRRVTEAAQAAREAAPDGRSEAATAEPEQPAGQTGAVSKASRGHEDAELAPVRADASDIPEEEPVPPVARRPAQRPVDESAIEAAIQRAQAAKAEREQPPALAEHAEVVSQPSEPIAFPTRGNVLPKVESAPDGLAASLERIERTLTDIDQTVRLLAAQLNHRPAAPYDGMLAAPPREAEWEDEAPAVMSPGFGAPPRPAIFRDVVPVEPEAPPQQAPRPPVAAVQPDERRGFDLLPRTYRITVEDKRRAVDLVPLHRALLGMDGVKDMSLLSYNNGVALVSLETVNDIDTDALARAVSRAMSREARVETHNERTLVIKLAED